MYREIKAVLLIGLVALPALLVYCSLQLQKSRVRHEVKERLIEGMDRADLELLTFSHTEAEMLLNWKHDREFEFDGRMYDIVDHHATADSVSYLCWPDDEETQINLLLNSMTVKALAGDPFDQTSHDQLVNFLKTLCSVTPTCDISPLARSESLLNSNFIPPYTRWLSAPPTPPPNPSS